MWLECKYDNETDLYIYTHIYPFLNILLYSCRFQPPKYSDAYAAEYQRTVYVPTEDTTRPSLNGEPSTRGVAGGPIDLAALKHSDFDLPAMSFQYDYWEAVYRTERCRREELEALLGVRASVAVTTPEDARHSRDLAEDEMKCLLCNGSGVTRSSQESGNVIGEAGGVTSDDETDIVDGKMNAVLNETMISADRIQSEVDAAVKTALAENEVIVTQQREVRVMTV